MGRTLEAQGLPWVVRPYGSSPAAQSHWPPPPSSTLTLEGVGGPEGAGGSREEHPSTQNCLCLLYCPQAGS